MNRQRVQHREYKWLGDVIDTIISVGTGVRWVRVSWDNGEKSTEHEEDLIKREVSA